MINPPTAPSTVFFGLILGHNLCFPIKLPTKYAPASAIHAANNAITTYSIQCCGFKYLIRDTVFNAVVTNNVMPYTTQIS